MRGKKESTIVILDDVRENLYELAAIVDELGYVAKPVLTIGQAFRALSMGDVMLLLLDIAMPEMSGFEFLRRMRQEKAWDEIPVVFISAYQDQDTKLEAFGLGAYDYIMRPFDEKECGCRIKQAADEAELRKRLQMQKEDMKQMLAIKGAEMEKAKRQLVESVLVMVKEQEGSKGHFRRIRESAAHFAKGLLVVPEFESALSDSFVELLRVAAPLYVLWGSPEKIAELKDICSKGAENEYLKMGIEIAEGYRAISKGKAASIPLCAQIISLAVWYDKLTGTVGERMEIIDREAARVYNPLLVHAFHIIQLPYFLDKEGE